METLDRETLQKFMPETGAFTYRKIILVDLERDRGMVLKSDPNGWQPEDGPITAQLAEFALSGALHREDAESFMSFTRLDQLSRAPDTGSEALTLLYRRKEGSDYRWNLMEVIPDQRGGTRFVTLCIKDVDDVLRESAQREGMARQHLDDRAYIISSLSSLFFSTYYVDLEKNTFRAVTQLSRVGDVLGDEVDLTSALEIYANHFIHPDDRAEYLRTMGAENLRENLRWWQPTVAYEYRKLPNGLGSEEGPFIWVRATAVLARTGEDDRPKTAVYVAQDISSGRRTN